MNVRISISGVDGETDFSINTKDVESSKQFLKAYDHEGSSLYLTVMADDSEEVYKILEKLGK